MHGASADEDFRFGCVEILKFNFVCRSSVDRVGILRSEFGNIKEVRSFPDLLVRSEGDAERSVRKFLRLNGFDGGHDLRNARLVVGSEQSRAVGRDECVSDEVFHERVECCVEFQSGAAEADGRAVPVFDDLRTDIRPACAVGGVHVRDESEGVGVFVSGCGGQLRTDVAFGSHAHVFEFERAQLFRKMFRELALFRGRRMSSGRFIGLGIKGAVIKQTFENGFHRRPFVFASNITSLPDEASLFFQKIKNGPCNSAKCVYIIFKIQL